MTSPFRRRSSLAGPFSLFSAGARPMGDLTNELNPQ